MNVGNNLEMNNWNNNQESQNLQEEDEFLRLIFKRIFEQEEKNFNLTVLCKENELLSEVLKRYCHKTIQKKEDLIFLYNSQKLREDKTVQELGLFNGSSILVITYENMIGG